MLVVRRDSLQSYARILLGTDFSATSTRALRFTLDTFPDAWYIVVHAHSVECEGRSRLGGATDEDIKRYRQSEREAAQRKMQAFITDCDYRAASGWRHACAWAMPPRSWKSRRGSMPPT